MMIQKAIDNILQMRVNDWTGRDFFTPPPMDSMQANFSCNDYLGLATDERMMAARAEAAHETRASVKSPAFVGPDSPHAKLEDKIADWLGYTGCLLVPSGWAASAWAVQAFRNIGVPVYIDTLAHMSLWRGTTLKGGPVHRWHHNNLNHLAEIVDRPGLIVVDSIYSTDGSIAPLDELSAFARTLGCLLIVDESHALGVTSAHGKGIVVREQIQDVAILVSSLGKAFGARAGIICCPAEMVRLFKLESDYAFSTAILEHELPAIDLAFDLVPKAVVRRGAVWHAGSYLRTVLEQVIGPTPSRSQIVAVEVGDQKSVLDLREFLSSRGILSSYFIPPAVGRNRCIARLTVTHNTTDEEVHLLANTLDEWRNVNR